MLKKLLKTALEPKRLCPLMAMAFMFGCGKKITDPQTTLANDQDDPNALTPTTVTLQIDEAEGNVRSYTIPRNGIFELPHQLIVKQGNGAFKNVKISYNLDLDDDYEFHCFYKSVGQTDILPLLKCEEPNGGSFGDPTEWTMDQGKKIEMELTNPTFDDLVIEANFQVDWK